MPLSEETAPAVRDLVLRGALAGAVAGLVAWVFSLVFAEPLIDAAIGYEEARGAAEDALAGTAPVGGEEEVVSRGVQGTIGLGVGAVALGIGLGLLFAVAYAVVHGRVDLRPRALALLVALGGFVGIYATPFVKYPANPPAVGSDSTIAARSGLYLIMVIGSVALLVGAVLLARRLAGRLGTFNAVLVGVAAYVVLCGVLMAVLPSLGQLTLNVVENGPRASETPLPLRDPAGTIVFPGFDPDVLYSFRVSSLAAQALLWGVLGLVFGALVERLLARRGSTRESAPAPSAVAS